jgi:SAM-dependent methyltransferase
LISADRSGIQIEYRVAACPAQKRGSEWPNHNCFTRIRTASIEWQRSKIEVDQRVLSGERLPFEGGRFDCAVSTFTLCSIESVGQAVGEVYRVLRPGGRYLFLEHGLSPQPNVQKWQRRLNWLEMRLADGCHLDRNMKELVAALPFSSVEVEEFYLEKTPKTHGYLYRGVATK